MRRFQTVFLIPLLLLLSLSCNRLPEKPWINAVPGRTTAVIIPPAQRSISNILEAEYIPFLEDITSSAIQLVSQVDSYPNVDLTLKAVALYPGASDQLQPIWYVEAPVKFTDKLKVSFYRDFSQNEYRFHDQTVHKLHIEDRILFAVQLHSILLLSESSLGIEDAIRAYLGKSSSLQLSPEQLNPSVLILNTPSLDHWFEQVVKVGYRPGLVDLFRGTGPSMLKVTTVNGEDEQSNDLIFNGEIPLTGEPTSEMIAAISSENAPVTLDRYISSNAAAFSIFRLPPRLAPPSSIPDSTRLDSLLMADKVRYANLAETLDTEFALVLYAESGFLSVGEHLFIRKLKDRNAFVNGIRRLVGDGYIETRDNSYFVRSKVISRMIGSEISGFSDFYLDITGDAVVISKRKGLAELIASDRSRRRVIYYESDYLDARQQFPDQPSGLIVARNELYDFIAPFLDPDHNISAFTSKFDMLTVTLQLDESQNQLAFNLRTYSEEKSDLPYQEKWLFPISRGGLTGDPVLEDIRGSSRDEIIFATSDGRIYVLATDGTIVMQTEEIEETPVGSPVIYDWYGTNQKVILVGAGNKIYGWNDTGEVLPRFPFELPEKISAPITISDLDRNGLPEVIAATADRKIHVLNGRGNNIPGWPVTTNAMVRTRPLVDYFQGARSLVAYSENAVHAWSPDGRPRPDFPTFINATLAGHPVIYNDNLLAGAADGYLYSIGRRKLFADSLNIYSNLSDSLNYEAVYVSNSPLTGSPSVNNLTVQNEEQTFREPMILTMSNNGSVFLLNENGQLRFTQNMGQPGARKFSPFVVDIDQNGTQEIVALAGFGRLYAWQVTDGERLYSLPTSGMQYPIVADIDQDGENELIAQTQEGLRCWTIYGSTE